jgi:aldehyde:ferredoxin oxidoreductase
MSAGNAVALAMELSERGLLSRADTDGLEVRFGSVDALLGVIRLIAERKGIGDLLAEGMRGVKRVHPEWAPYVLDVKGMPFAGYDPRGFHGSGLTYGTSSRGACHNTGGWTIRAELQDPAIDRYEIHGKGALVKAIQDGRAYLDSTGMCSFVRAAFGFGDTPAGDVLEAVTGHAFTPRLLEIAERIYSLERIILNREGIRRADDLLPDRIMREKIPSGPTKGRVLTPEMYAVMLDEYYAARGWDADGVVTVVTRRRLGLE